MLSCAEHEKSLITSGPGEMRLVSVGSVYFRVQFPAVEHDVLDKITKKITGKQHRQTFSVIDKHFLMQVFVIYILPITYYLFSFNRLHLPENNKYLSKYLPSVSRKYFLLKLF